MRNKKLVQHHRFDFHDTSITKKHNALRKLIEFQLIIESHIYLHDFNVESETNINQKKRT